MKSRYLAKISVVKIDPAMLIGVNLDPECLPPIEATDLLCYLVMDTSFYTKEQFKAFKSMEAYNQMVSGFITSVQGKVICDKFVVIGKVRHSQRMNEPALPVWIITSKEGTIISAHCLGCKAGLSETCSHVASLLFYIEAWTRINGKLACTQVKCTWLLPTYVSEVPYTKVQDINFHSAKKLKEDLDEKIKNFSEPRPNATTAQPTSLNNLAMPTPGVLPNCSSAVPSKTEMETLFAKLNECAIKPVALSLVQPYCEQFILKSRDIPTTCDLFYPSYLDLTYPELLRKCAEIYLTLSDAELKLIEKDTRTQARGTAFFRHRAGRIGASSSWAASHTNPAMPSQSLIKSMCYPHLFKVNSKAIIHGRRNEVPAIDAYAKVMSKTHRDFKVEHCGMIIDKHHPWIHATPDAMTSCSCCGDGCCEVKCPYSIENGNFEAYVGKKDSCLEKVNNTSRLKRNHQYLYQVQQQLFVTGHKYCDFVMCSFLNNKQPVLFIERIYQDPYHWDCVLPKLTKFWRTCILPEVLGRWYTRKHDIAAPPPISTPGPSICYCRKPRNEMIVSCENPKCPFTEFHYSCLEISGPLPKPWYCPICQLLPQCKKLKKAPQKTLQNLDEALKYDSICICKAKPKVGEKKCHSTNCQNGNFFHLQCLQYKRMPNNNKTTWVCSDCKVNLASPTTCSSLNTTTSSSIHDLSSVSVNHNSATTAFTSRIDINSPTTCSSTCTTNMTTDNKPCLSDDGQDSTDEFESDDDDIVLTFVGKGESDRVGSFGNLDANDHDTILSPTGWLDCKVIHECQIYLQKVNPLIEGFQRPTLGPVRNFSIMTSDFVQILHTGRSHWVCVSSINCPAGMVNLYDSLFNEIIENEVEEQVKSLFGGNFQGITNVPVQQQLNGSDCGVFAVAFVTCLVYGSNPQDFMFHIPQMRPHLLECLKAGDMRLFPHF